MKHIRTIDIEHEYQIIDRESGEFGGSCTLQFIKIMGGEVEHGGCFTQDVVEVLVDRLQYQVDNETDDKLRIRRLILWQLKLILWSYKGFTYIRHLQKQRLLGHEYDKAGENKQ